MIGSFFAVLLLFAPAVVLLGMVSPFAIRLAISDVETAGAVAGRFYALSTAGSLLGTFVPALVAIPLVGTQRTLLGTAVLLALSASFLLGRQGARARGRARRARRACRPARSRPSRACCTRRTRSTSSSRSSSVPTASGCCA